MTCTVVASVLLCQPLARQSLLLFDVCPCKPFLLSHGNEDFVFRVCMWHTGPVPHGRLALRVALVPSTLSWLASTSGRGAISSSQHLPQSLSVSVTCPGTGLFSMDISVSSFAFQNCPTVSRLCPCVDIFLEKLEVRTGIVGARGRHL